MTLTWELDGHLVENIVPVERGVFSHPRVGVTEAGDQQIEEDDAGEQVEQKHQHH